MAQESESAQEEVTPSGDTKKVAAEAEEKEEKKEPIFQRPLINRVVVSATRALNFYVDRSRRILRLEPELRVTGFGNTVSMACTLVEVLKRQKIAVVKKVSTGMDVQPVVNRRTSDYQWSNPITQITFILGPGEFADCVQDYHQRKVIEIFERNLPANEEVSADKDHSDSLSKQKVRDLKFAENFFADEKQQGEAEAYLKSIPGDKVTLPQFIRYASRLIHPRLRDKVFKEQLRKHYLPPKQLKERPQEPDAQETEEVEES